MKEYRMTIGLEIHAELKTVTKMFCNSKNDPDETKPNVNVCPICMAHPGTLPVINKEAVKHILKIGLALGGEIADITEFDRKNYFYPDIPKGYQISQYKYPLVTGGALNGIAITRVHLEEDTARSTHLSVTPAGASHAGGQGTTQADEKGDCSLVDFNRAGIPLMELVTEPVIENAAQAGALARELQLLLRCLGASEANMEKGEMRVEANISLREIADTRGTNADQRRELGTKVEVKNLNSFRSVERAIAYERKRQTALLERGEKVIQETRGWDEVKQLTFSQRTKEESHDYRYFPDPDLPKLKISEIEEFNKLLLKEELPELPWEKRNRFVAEFGIKEEDAAVLVRSVPLSALFEDAVSSFRNDISLIQKTANYVTSDLAGILRDTSDTVPFRHEYLTLLMQMIKNGEISSRGAKDILAALTVENKDPRDIAKEKGLLQRSGREELRHVAEEVIKENSRVAEDYKKGKEASLQFLVGQAMKKTKGAANPVMLHEIFRELL